MSDILYSASGIKRFQMHYASVRGPTSIVTDVCLYNVILFLSCIQTEDGISMAASRLLTILKVSAGLSPMATTALYLSALTRCTVPSELDED